MIISGTGHGRLVGSNGSGSFQSRNGNKIPYINFTVACDREYKDQNGDYPADFFNCTVMGHNATYLHNYGRKGYNIVFSFRPRTYNSKKYQTSNGKPLQLVELQITDLEIIFPPRNNGNQNNGGNYQNQNNGSSNYNANNTNTNNTPQNNASNTNANNTNSNNAQPQNTNGGQNTQQKSSSNSSNGFASGSKIDVSDDDLPF